ncbi:hypothetical protein N9N13_00120 [Opitutales bacterium]|nr:hypothetical protein [Opitutales bacterium]
MRASPTSNATRRTGAESRAYSRRSSTAGKRMDTRPLPALMTTPRPSSGSASLTQR